MKIIANWPLANPQLRSLLRVVAAFTFIPAGTMKLFGWPASAPSGSPEMFSQIWFGGVLEVVGGTLLLIGLLTRPTAFILSGMMAAAYWQFHSPGGFWPSLNGGLPAVLYCFVFLYLSAAGGGPWGLDAMLKRNAPTHSEENS